MNIHTFNPNNYATHSRPELVELLQAIGLDVVYEQGEGNSLTYRNDVGDEVRVLDLLGGFGVSLFGHNHPELVATACEVLGQKRPFVAQGSVRGFAGALAKKLSDMVEASTGQSYITTFANSGAEAVEAALKHAAWEKKKAAEEILAQNDHTFRVIRTKQRGGEVAVTPELFTAAEALLNVAPIANLSQLQYVLRRHNEQILDQGHCFIGIQGAFHGKTTGAVQLTYNPEFRQPWQHLGLRATFTPLNDENALTEILVQQRTSYLALTLTANGGIELTPQPWSRIVACLAEPILGEGGIYPLTAVFLQALRTAADDEQFPLILDEIQSGMGRSGTFLASEPSGIYGDYYLFSKALGGGLAKISAVLIDRRRYIKRFGYVHTSTFADDDFSCAVALKALTLLEQDDLISRCQQRGDYLLSQLRVLQQQYPTVIREVRGRGLLVGIELAPLSHSPSQMLQIAAEQHLLGFLLCGYLLHEHQIRVTPTISATNTIRIEPSALISEEEIDYFCHALVAGIKLLHEGDAHQFTRFITGTEKVEREDGQPTLGETAVLTQNHVKSGHKVACLVHFLEPEDLLRFDPRLAPLTSEECSQLLAQTQLVIEPFVLGEQTITTGVSDSVQLSVIGIPYTSAQIAARQQANQLGPVLTAIEQGVEIARGLGCTVIGLTGYTSIVTQNGTHFAEDELAFTSGNSLTAAAAVSAIQQLTAEKRMEASKMVIGVVGGVGNIGAILSEILLDTFSSLRLIGRPASVRRLSRLQQKLQQQNPEATIEIFTDVSDLANCQVIVSATNAPQPIIEPKHVGDHPTILCDVAVPADVVPHLAASRPQAQVVRGGRFLLPCGQVWQIPGLDTGEGETYACVVETLLLGLAGVRHHFSYGALETTKVRHIQHLAEHYGFELAIQFEE